MLHLTSIPLDPSVLSPPPTFAQLDAVGGFFTSITNQLGPFLLKLLGALAILVVGWLLAVVVASAIRKILSSTDWDNRLWASVFGESTEKPNIEAWAAGIVYWIILAFAILAFFDTLGLEQISSPLNVMLTKVTDYLPTLASGLALAGVAWLVATGAKMLLVRGLAPIKLDDQLAEQAEGGGAPPIPVSETLGTALYWLILLVFTPLILGVLQLNGPLAPIQTLLDRVLAAIPNILTAGAVGVVGWFIAKIVRGLVTSLLQSVGTDAIGQKLGLSADAEAMTLSKLLGSITFILILIPTAIAALTELSIEAISGPAIAMLEQFMTVLPQVFTAALILVIFYAIGRFIGDFVTGFLSGIGFDSVTERLGVSSLMSLPEGESEENASQTKSASEIAGIATLVAIVLLGAVAATEVLALAAINDVVTQLLEIAGRVLIAVIIFGVGLYLSNLAASLIASSSNTAQTRLFALAARISILALVGAMSLQQMGIATEIVVLAFGLIFGGLTVAFAIAFGTGGREVAATQLKEWFDNRNTPQ